MDSLRKGSMTVFLSFVLGLSAALICVQLFSAKLAVSRVQIVAALDVGLYSLFAQYDRDLLEQFELFYLDGSFGGGQLDMGKGYDVVKQYAEPVLRQNFTELALERGGWSGYCLATDEGGASFYRQAVQAASGLVAKQGIQALLEKVQSQAGEVQRQETIQEQVDREQILEQYDQELARQEERKEGEAEGGFQREGESAVPVERKENPIEVIRRIRKMGILELVLPDPQKVSANEADLSMFVSGRKRYQGMPLYRAAPEEKSGDGLLFQEYLLQKCGNFLRPGKGSLSYQTEYLLFGADSDLENLKKVVNRLLLLREGANLVHLYGDPEKSSQARALAAGIAAALLLPLAEPVIHLAILSCWAFGESVLDVRELLAGGKTALVKTKESWQLSLEHLPQLLECLDSDRRSPQDGFGYEEYLRILLWMESKEKKIMRGMDMVECALRGETGREDFRLDCCIGGAEVMVDVQAGGGKNFSAVWFYTYEGT